MSETTATLPAACRRHPARYRSEHDLIGDRDIPAEAYWGVHTLRAVENFPITGQPLSTNTHLVAALAMVKQAAARPTRNWACSMPRAPRPSSRPAAKSSPANSTTSSWST